MQVRKSISRIAIATMVAAAVAVPTAGAMPSEGVVYGSAAYAAEQQDMHASTVQKPESSAGDRRGEGSIAGSRAQADVKPIVSAPADPVTATDGDGGTIDWPITLLIAAGAIALAGALALVLQQRRTQARPVR